MPALLPRPLLCLRTRTILIPEELCARGRKCADAAMRPLPLDTRRIARAQTMQMREEKTAAAKLQAAKRGKDAREQVRERRQAAAAAEAAAAVAKEEEAAVMLSAGAKGYLQRKRLKREQEEMAKASVSTRLALFEFKCSTLATGRESELLSSPCVQMPPARQARIQANFRGRKEREDPMSEANVRKARREDDPAHKAERYLEVRRALPHASAGQRHCTRCTPRLPRVALARPWQEHNILDLFDLLGQKVVAARPKDLRGFLIEELTKLKGTSDPSSPMNFFSPTVRPPGSPRRAPCTPEARAPPEAPRRIYSLRGAHVAFDGALDRRTLRPCIRCTTCRVAGSLARSAWRRTRQWASR